MLEKHRSGIKLAYVRILISICFSAIAAFLKFKATVMGTLDNASVEYTQPRFQNEQGEPTVLYSDQRLIGNLADFLSKVLSLDILLITFNLYFVYFSIIPSRHFAGTGMF